MVKRSLRFQTAQTLKSPILPASPRRFSSGSYEASNVPVLTVSIISKKHVFVARRGVSVYRLGTLVTPRPGRPQISCPDNLATCLGKPLLVQHLLENFLGKFI